MEKAKSEVESENDKRWIMDSGASYHMCSDLKMFDTYEPYKQRYIELADGSRCQLMGRGNVKIELLNNVVITLTNVVYIPSAALGSIPNLISLGALESQGYEIILKNKVARVLKDSNLVMFGLRTQANLYYTYCKTFARKHAIQCPHLDDDDDEKNNEEKQNNNNNNNNNNNVKTSICCWRSKGLRRFKIGRLWRMKATSKAKPIN